MKIGALLLRDFHCSSISTGSILRSKVQFCYTFKVFLFLLLLSSSYWVLLMSSGLWPHSQIWSSTSFQAFIDQLKCPLGTTLNYIYFLNWKIRALLLRDFHCSSISTRSIPRSKVRFWNTSKFIFSSYWVFLKTRACDLIATYMN